MNNIKHPIFVGVLLILLGLGSIFAFRALNFFTSNPSSFLQTTALLTSDGLLAAGAVMLFLHFFKPKMK